MRTKRFKRLCLELLQHLLAAGIMLAAASLLLNSYIAVDSIDLPRPVPERGFRHHAAGGLKGAA